MKIQITIEEITVEEDGITVQDMSCGKVGKEDKIIRTPVYMQTFKGMDEIQIRSIAKYINCLGSSENGRRG